MAVGKPRLLLDHDFPRPSILLGSPWISLCFHGPCYAMDSPHELPSRFVSTLLLLLSAACDTCRHSSCHNALRSSYFSCSWRGQLDRGARCCTCHWLGGADSPLSAKQRIADEGVHAFQQRR